MKGIKKAFKIVGTIYLIDWIFCSILYRYGMAMHREEIQEWEETQTTFGKILYWPFLDWWRK